MNHHHDQRRGIVNLYYIRPNSIVIISKIYITSSKHDSSVFLIDDELKLKHYV